MLADITAVISEAGANIRTFESGGEDLHARVEVALDIHDRKQLERILTNSRRFRHFWHRTRLQRLKLCLRYNCPTCE